MDEEVSTYEELKQIIRDYDRLIEDVRGLCELDGTNRVVDSIRRRIDNERYRVL